MSEFGRSAISTAYALHEISMRSDVAMKYEWDSPLDPAPRSRNIIVGYSITLIIGAILLILPLIFLACSGASMSLIALIVSRGLGARIAFADG